MDLMELREQINEIDREMLDLFLRRMQKRRDWRCRRAEQSVAERQRAVARRKRRKDDQKDDRDQRLPPGQAVDFQAVERCFLF